MAVADSSSLSAAVQIVFRQGKPYLFGERWQTLVEANDWLYDLRRDGATMSRATWRAYAYGLADLLAWCASGALDWRTLGQGELDRYLGSLTVIDDTVNHRVTILVRFYGWCRVKGIVTGSPFEFRETWVHRPGFLSGRVTRRIMRPTVMRRIAHVDKIRVPRAHEVWALRDAMGCWRDRLIIETLAFTGLRCAELLGLRTEPFLNARIAPKETAILLPILGKGRKKRLVPFPAGLVRNIQRYIVLERKYAAGAETDSVFISAKGAPLQPSGAEHLMRQASKKLGQRVYPHLLRHFFACHRLKYLSGLGLGDPLGQLQRELGHSQSTTTARYLHLTDELRARIASDHQDFIAAISGGKNVFADEAWAGTSLVQMEVGH